MLLVENTVQTAAAPQDSKHDRGLPAHRRVAPC